MQYRRGLSVRDSPVCADSRVFESKLQVGPSPLSLSLPPPRLVSLRLSFVVVRGCRRECLRESCPRKFPAKISRSCRRLYSILRIVSGDLNSIRSAEFRAVAPRQFPFRQKESTWRDTRARRLI